MVHHNSREGAGLGEPVFSQHAGDRDQRLAKLLSFCAYKSPSDSVAVEVPELPEESDFDADEVLGVVGQPGHHRKKKKHSPEMADAIRRRKDARRDQLEQAWSGWQKPLIKPGDTLCLLKPWVGNRDSSQEYEPSDDHCRLVVAHRFWTENEERGRHLFWIPGGMDLSTPRATLFESRPGLCVLRDGQKPEQFCSALTASCTDLCREISLCSLRSAHPGSRGPQIFTPVSSMGRLDSDDEYFIYRFLLFWDGFEVSKGKAASGDGFYMVCLNLPDQARNTANAVRIISVCPPGIKSSAMCEHIKADILQDMTEGFIDIDACGTRRKIFLGLVGFLGDTPALNAVLDILGHTASCCCHLCNFRRRSEGLLGSRYTALHQSGEISASRRGFYQHLAVRDCKAGKEPCKILGIKPNADPENLPVHSMREAMMAARAQIPTTCGGQPILSGYLDPYRSCFVAPDHLLTGHLRDSVNLAFKLLPSKEHRQSCEDFMIGILRDCQLPAQNRLFDMEKKTLYSMSMTEMYALSILAEHGFRKGCEAKDYRTDTRYRPSSKCIEAISIVGSISRIIAALWRLPSQKDAPYASVSFNRGGGYRRVNGLKQMILSHISSLRCICSMEDADVLELENNSCSGARKAQLAKLRVSCLLARRCVDKPNIHRLLELGSSTLPMIGYVTRVGELSLEKAHQSLKRAIQQSNNKDVQMHSTNSAIFNDWQARLTMLVGAALSGDKYAILGCYRLLEGREAAIESDGFVTSFIEMQVRRALGPPCCVPTFLAAEGKSVISPRYSSGSNLCASWAIHGNMNSFTLSLRPTEDSRIRVYSSLRECGLFDEGTVITADALHTTAKNGTPLLSLTRGDVVEIVAYRPLDASFHTPFIVHRHSVGQEMEGSREGTSIWAISTFVSVSVGKAEREIWAAVHPCLRAICEVDTQNHRYHVGNSLSFVKVDLRILSKADVLHDCHPSSCTLMSAKLGINHGNESLLQAQGVFYVVGRAKGYLPRRG